LPWSASISVIKTPKSTTGYLQGVSKFCSNDRPI
jgi:hypothetical protein